MPLGVKPCCASCKTTDSPMWRKNKKGYIQCNSCGLKDLPPANDMIDNGNGSTALGKNGNQQSGNGGKGREGTRKSSRNMKKLRYKQMVTSAVPIIKYQSTKGKGRRIIFKRNPMRAPESVATVVTCDSVFYKGIYMQVGDIVSILDVDGGIFYAQIKGLMQDQYCDKSAVITWLLPTQATDPEKFDPATYILGPEEDLPRSLEYMEFVCHAPSEYYKAKNSPYPVIPSREETGFVWSTIIPMKPPSTAQIFGAS